MTNTEYTNHLATFSRFAGELNAMGEIDLNGGKGNFSSFADFADCCVRNWDESGRLDFYAEDCLTEEYPADYTRTCRDLSDRVFSRLFAGSPYSTADGLQEIPGAAYQLMVSALELIRWEISGQKDREAVNQVLGILEHLRDEQKLRERSRRVQELKKEAQQ